MSNSIVGVKKDSIEFMENKAIEVGEIEGYKYMILPAPMEDALNGYIVFPKCPVRESDYNGILTYVPVHGGITFCHHYPEGTMYGFDTLHHDSHEYPRTDKTWIKEQISIMLKAILVAARVEKNYLKAITNKGKAKWAQMVSRRNDNLKSDLLESKWLTGIVVVEIFPQDLQGDIKQNILNRILITQDVLFNRHHFVKCARLETLYLYLIGIKNKASSRFLDKCAMIHRGKTRTGNFKTLIIAMEQHLADPGLYKNGRDRIFDINNVCEISGLSVLYGKLLNERHFKSSHVHP